MLRRSIDERAALCYFQRKQTMSIAIALRVVTLLSLRATKKAEAQSEAKGWQSRIFTGVSERLLRCFAPRNDARFIGFVLLDSATTATR